MGSGTMPLGFRIDQDLKVDLRASCCRRMCVCMHVCVYNINIFAHGIALQGAPRVEGWRKESRRSPPCHRRCL